MLSCGIPGFPIIYPLDPSPCCLYNKRMFGCRIGFPQQYPFSPDIHPCISDEGEFCVCTKHRYGMEEPPLMAVLDTHGRGTIITQQLSNSATQQLSNSATQQRKHSLDNFSSLFQRKVHHFFSSAKDTSQSLICFFQFIRIINRAYYRRRRQALWFDSG